MHCRLGATVQRVDLGNIALQQFLHGLGYVLGVKGALVAVAQHCGNAVVAGHDHIAAARGVKGIEGGVLARCGSAQLGCFQGHLQAGGRHFMADHEC